MAVAWQWISSRLAVAGREGRVENGGEDNDAESEECEIDVVGDAADPEGKEGKDWGAATTASSVAGKVGVVTTLRLISSSYFESAKNGERNSEHGAPMSLGARLWSSVGPDVGMTDVENDDDASDALAAEAANRPSWGSAPMTTLASRDMLRCGRRDFYNRHHGAVSRHAPPTHLALSSGSTKCLSFVGALEEMAEEYGPNWLPSLRGCSCCSGGSLVALALVTGMSLGEIRHFVESVDFGLMRGTGGAVSRITRFVRYRGAFPGQTIQQLAEALLERGLGTGPAARTTTFAELKAMTGRDLVVVAMSLRHRMPVIFSPSATPDEFVSCAVRASCSIPAIFDPVATEDGDLLVDGALGIPFPVRLFDDEGGGGGRPPARTVGLYIKPTGAASKTADLRTCGFEDYFHALAQALTWPVGDADVEREAHRAIVIAVPELPFTQMAIAPEVKSALLDCGREAARAWMDGCSPSSSSENRNAKPRRFNPVLHRVALTRAFAVFSTGTDDRSVSS